MDATPTSETRPAPSTAVRDDERPSAPGVDPAADGRDPEQIVREARAAAGASVDADAARFADQTESIRAHLGAFYTDPDRALQTLEGLDRAGREDFAAGRIDIGERRADAPGEPMTDGLLAHVDVREYRPGAAAAFDTAREADRARGPGEEVGGPDPGRDGPTDARRQEADPSKQSLGDELSPMNRIEHQLAYQAAGPQQL